MIGNHRTKTFLHEDMIVTKGRALLQIDKKKGRASLGQGRALRPVETG
jgi:hypothetical protein